MAGHSVAANLMMLVFLLGGLLFALQIKKEVFPDFELDTVTVSVEYPGASPEEVEQGIILAVEEAVQGLDDVKEVTASAREGGGVVTIEMLVGGNLQKLSQDVQSEVDRITTFPEEAEEPRVEVVSHRRQVLSVVLYGDHDERVLRDTAETVRDRLLQDPGITQVDLTAVRDLEIDVEVSQDSLRAYGLTLEKIASRLRQAAVELPGGGIKTTGGEILVRMKERRDYGKEFARIPIITSDEGSELLLEDIATITDGFEDTDRYATYNGQRAVMLDVYRVGDQTPLSVADAVRTRLESIEKTLPPGMAVDTLNDFSDHYRQRLDLLLKNGYLGLILVFVLLGLFLEPRLAFWVTMGIPISFLGAFLFLPAMGVSINMMSMFAFIVALGIVVDDAIVVGENVYKFRTRGHSFMAAAVMGVREVATPVTFSILTNIATFLPLYFVPGTPGKIFRAIPVVVITVFIISLIESIFILPAHLGHQRENARRGPMAWFLRRQQGFSKGFSRLIERVYGPIVRLTLRSRYPALAVGLALLVLTAAYVKSGRIGITLFERIESDFAYAMAVLPYGTAVENTEAVMDKLVKTAQAIADENGGDKLVQGIFAEIGAAASRGSAGSHVAKVRVFLTPPEVRPMQTGQFVKLWRRRAGQLPGLESMIFKSYAGGPGSRSAMTVELSHRDLSVLEAAGRDLADALALFPKVKDIDDGFSPGKQQIDFTIRPEGRILGLTAQEVAHQVRHAFYGAEVLRQQRGRNEVKVMVRLPEAERISEYDLEELILRTSVGKEVCLREVVNLKRGRAYTTIDRRNGRRVITVTADVDPPSEAERILAAVEKETLPELTVRYPGLRYGFEGRQADMKESMKSLYLGLALAMMAVYSLLAVPFRSYSQPAIVMSSIPFGLIGAVLGHMIMGYDMSIMSLFGMVALTGVVVNDSLVLIDFANRRRMEGHPAQDALVAAGILRFRPILLTSLTTFGALIPMIFETSRQARFLIPMALSLGFGVLFATLVTLLLVPALYLIVEDVKGLWGKTSESSSTQETAVARTHG